MDIDARVRHECQTTVYIIERMPLNQLADAVKALKPRQPVDDELCALRLFIVIAPHCELQTLREICCQFYRFAH